MVRRCLGGPPKVPQTPEALLAANSFLGRLVHLVTSTLSEELAAQKDIKLQEHVREQIPRWHLLAGEMMLGEDRSDSQVHE